MQFTDDLTIAVCSDSGGSVFELEMKWVQSNAAVFYLCISTLVNALLTGV